jgi:hypothetical protein
MPRWEKSRWRPVLPHPMCWLGRAEEVFGVQILVNWVHVCSLGSRLVSVQ